MLPPSTEASSRPSMHLQINLEPLGANSESMLVLVFVVEPCCPAHIALHAVLFVLVILSKRMNEWVSEWCSVPVLIRLELRNVFQTVFFVSKREHCIHSQKLYTDVVFSSTKTYGPLFSKVKCRFLLILCSSVTYK